MCESNALPIRPAKPDDVHAIHSFLQPFVDAQQLLPRTMDEVSVLIRHGFVAELSRAIVGFAAVEIYSQKMAEVQCLAVSRDHQGRGIGSRLVRCCIQRARDLNVRELMAITASERLFEGCGFRYSLPNQKRALFIQTRDDYERT